MTGRKDKILTSQLDKYYYDIGDYLDEWNKEISKGNLRGVLMGPYGGGTMPEYIRVAGQECIQSIAPMWKEAYDKWQKVGNLGSHHAQIAAGVEGYEGPGVIIKGLTSARGLARYDGRHGILGKKDENTGRWHVVMDGGEIASFKPENIIIQDGGAFGKRKTGFGNHKVHFGSRGGRYIMKNGKKKYI